MTLFETGVIDLLKNGNYKFLDRYKEKIILEEIKNIYREAFYAYAYFTSTNAIIEKGKFDAR